MNIKQAPVYQSIRRSNVFLKPIKGLSESAQLLKDALIASEKEVDALIKAEEKTDATKAVIGQSPTRLKYQLRARLKVVSKRAVKVLKGLPGIRDSMRLPPYKGKVTTHLDAADRILTNLRPHEKPFLAATKLAPSCFKDIESLADELRAATERVSTSRRRPKVRDDLQEALSRGRGVIDDLDPILALELRPAEYATWKKQKRVFLNKRPGPRPKNRRGLAKLA